MKAWAGADRRVTAYSKAPTGKVIRKREFPAAVMYAADLYADHTHPLTDDQAHRLESVYLQQLDQRGATLQREMLAGQLPRGAAGRRDWVRFVMSLMTRHPDSIEKFRRLHDVMWKEHEAEGIRNIRAAMPEMDPILAGARYVELSRAKQEAARVDSLRRMMDFGIAGQALIQANWDVLDLSNAPDALVLADKPVFRTQTFRDADDFIAVPLGPRHLFKATIGRRLRGPLSASLAERFTSRINGALIRGAGTFIIAVDDAQGEAIRAAMGTEPQASIADIMAEPFAL
jgi:hypothetical protein